MTITVVCIFHVTWERTYSNSNRKPIKYTEDGFTTIIRNHINGFCDNVLAAVEWAKKDCTEEALREACEGDTLKLVSWTATYCERPEDGCKVIHGN